MPIPIRNTKAQKIKNIKVKLDKFDKGVNKLVEETRLKENEAVEAQNLMLEQDGVYTPRWGTSYYTPEIGAADNICGFSEYVKSDGTKELIAVGDDGRLYKSTDGGSWTNITGS